jgi:hypothetical protein
MMPTREENKAFKEAVRVIVVVAWIAAFCYFVQFWR